LVVFMLTLNFGFATAGIPISISNSTFQANGAETMTIDNVSVLGGSYWLQFQWNQNTYKWDLIGYGQETDPALTNAKKLLGNWTFQYTIISTFTQQYLLTTVDTSNVNSQGGYFVSGVDAYGDAIGASHFPDNGYYALLDPGTYIDRFFTFTIDGNTASGCYYQISTSTGDISKCYTMWASKTALSSSDHSSNANREVGLFSERIEVEEAEEAGDGERTMDPIHKMQYEALKSFYLENSHDFAP